MRHTKISHFLVALTLLALVLHGVSCKKGERTQSTPAAKVAEPAVAQQEIILDLGNNVTMKLVLIPAGKFQMGSPDSESGRNSNEGPQHEVTISEPFYMGTYEVTQEQYEAVTGNNPSYFKSKTNPVEKVSWNDAAKFCDKLSQKTGKVVRLPTEAEWEYACRAGTKTPFYMGESISSDEANYKSKDEDRQRTVPVGTFKPNGFGLYDMHGNVHEWCSDWYADSYANAGNIDPEGPMGADHVARGGSWYNSPQYCRSASRAGLLPDFDGKARIGFRVVLALKHRPPKATPIALDDFLNTIRKGDLAAVRRMLETEPRLLNAKGSNEDTPLHIASRAGKEGITALLLDAGASVSARNVVGETPLHSATIDGQEGIAKMLLVKGADVNAKELVRGDTPLHYAAELDNVELTKTLLDRKPDVNARNLHGEAPLHIAVKHDRADVARTLLTSGAQVDVRDEVGRTPLHLAASSLCGTDMVELLLARGADVGAKDEWGATPLHRAVEFDQEEKVKLLLRKGADVEVRKSSDGKTAIDCAKQGSRVLELLKAASVSPNQE